MRWLAWVVALALGCASVPDVPDGAVPLAATCQCAARLPLSCAGGWCGFPGTGTVTVGHACVLARADRVCLTAGETPADACARYARVVTFALWAVYYGPCGPTACGAAVTCDVAAVTTVAACATPCAPVPLDVSGANRDSATVVTGPWRTACPGDAPWVDSETVCRAQ